MDGKGSRQAVIDDLNRLMAEEAEASLRYFHMRFRLHGRGRHVAAAFFESALKETLEHADAIAQQIQALGHVPSLQIHLHLDDRPIAAQDALAEAIEIEQQALDAYQEFLTRVSGEPRLEDFARRQIEVETAHVRELRDALHERNPFGLIGKDAADLPDEASSAVPVIEARASFLMKRGMAFMSEKSADAAVEALACFDRARDLRARLPLGEVPVFRYGLAACWLNRAEALMQCADPAQIPDAVRAIDEAVQLLRTLPLGDDARFPRRLAIALQNRGTAMQALGSNREAVDAFGEAMAVLELPESQAIADRTYLAAAVCATAAGAHADAGTADSDQDAWTAGRRALALIAELEAEDPDAAEVGLKARHILCRMSARRLSSPADSGVSVPPDVHEATDLADDGLALVRHWERRGVTRFRDLAIDLFRFGVRVYKRYQPQFLTEFVAENMAAAQSSSGYVGAAGMQSAAAEARADSI